MADKLQHQFLVILALLFGVAWNLFAAWALLLASTNQAFAEFWQPLKISVAGALFLAGWFAWTIFRFKRSNMLEDRRSAFDKLMSEAKLKIGTSAFIVFVIFPIFMRDFITGESGPMQYAIICILHALMLWGLYVAAKRREPKYAIWGLMGGVLWNFLVFAVLIYVELYGDPYVLVDLGNGFFFANRHSQSNLQPAYGALALTIWFAWSIIKFYRLRKSGLSLEQDVP